MKKRLKIKSNLSKKSKKNCHINKSNLFLTQVKKIKSKKKIHQILLDPIKK